MGFSEFWNGTPPTTQMSGYTPWIKSPGYDFSSTLYSYLTGMIGQQAPRWKSPYGGQGGANAGPAVAPQMQALMQLGKRYMNTGMPTTFGTGLSSLGRFLAPSFANPLARLQMGAPNYFGSQAMPSQIDPWNPTPTPPWLRQQPQMSNPMPPQMGGQPPQQSGFAMPPPGTQMPPGVVY